MKKDIYGKITEIIDYLSQLKEKLIQIDNLKMQSNKLIPFSKD